MRGLYYKDFCSLKKLLHTLIPVCIATLIFALLVVMSLKYGNLHRMMMGEFGDSVNADGIPVIILYVISITLLIPMGFFVDSLRCFEMDEQAGFEKIVKCMPVTPVKVVSARYLIYFTFAGIGLSGALFSACIIAACAAKLSVTALTIGNLLFIIFTFTGILLLLGAVQIPLMYAFGRKTGTFVSVGIMIVPVIYLYVKLVMVMDRLADTEILPYLSDLLRQIKHMILQYRVGFVCALVALYFVSFMLSVAMYRRGGRK